MLFVQNKVTPESQTTPLKPIFYNYVNSRKTTTYLMQHHFDIKGYFILFFNDIPKIIILHKTIKIKKKKKIT